MNTHLDSQLKRYNMTSWPLLDQKTAPRPRWLPWLEMSDAVKQLFKTIMFSFKLITKSKLNLVTYNLRIVAWGYVQEKNWLLWGRVKWHYKLNHLFLWLAKSVVDGQQFLCFSTELQTW